MRRRPRLPLATATATAAAAAALAVAGLAMLVGTGPAAAHGGTAVIEVVEAVPDEDGATVTYLVALTYENDGDPVEDAVVTATPALAGAGPRPAVTLTPTGAGGGYRGTVTFPTQGDWVVRFASADPEASAQVTFTPPAPDVTAGTPPTTGAPPSSTAPDAGPARLVDDDTGDDGPPTGLVVGIGLAGLLLVATAALAVRRRRRPGHGAPPDA